MKSTDSGLSKYWIFFEDDTVEPVPVKAKGRKEAHRIGDKVHHSTRAAAATAEGEGDDFRGVDEDAFITVDDV